MGSPSVTGREWTIALPFSKPLSLNDRMHWRVKATHTKAWRGVAYDLARREQIPTLQRMTAVLHYRPRDNRARDVDNLVASLKPLIDGLRDAHVVDDDDTRHYTLTSPEIHRAAKGEPGRLWLVVRELAPLDDTED